jgi:hypothetical protein
LFSLDLTVFTVSRVSVVVWLALVPFVTAAETAPRLASPLTEFYASFGKPSFEEQLGRTSRIHWKPLRSSDRTLARVQAFTLEVDALDGVVRRVAVRCGHSLSEAETVKLAQRFFQRRHSASDVARVRDSYPDRRRYKLMDGDYVDEGPFKNHYIVVLSDGMYWRNVGVFDEEVAKKYPPTSIE